MGGEAAETIMWEVGGEAGQMGGEAALWSVWRCGAWVGGPNKGVLRPGPKEPPMAGVTQGI